MKRGCEFRFEYHYLTGDIFMSVTPSTLSAIQQAGQSIDMARHALVGAVNEHAQRVMAAIAEQP